MGNSESSPAPQRQFFAQPDGRAAAAAASSSPPANAYQERFYPQLNAPPPPPAPHPYQLPVGLSQQQWAHVYAHQRMPPTAAPVYVPPPPPPATTQATVRVRNDVTLCKDTLRLEHVGASRYALHFAVNAQTACRVHVALCANEHVDADDNTVRLDEHVVPRTSGAREVVVTRGQQRCVTFAGDDALDLSALSAAQLVHHRGTTYWPLVIVLTRVPDDEDDAKDDGASVEALLTYAAFAPAAADGARALTILRQKARVGAKSFVLEEIFGLDACQSADSVECVVCLAAPRNTTIYPCRHMVVCGECADSLRVQGVGAKCPVCRCSCVRGRCVVSCGCSVF